MNAPEGREPETGKRRRALQAKTAATDVSVSRVRQKHDVYLSSPIDTSPRFLVFSSTRHVVHYQRSEILEFRIRRSGCDESRSSTAVFARAVAQYGEAREHVVGTPANPAVPRAAIC